MKIFSDPKKLEKLIGLYLAGYSVTYIGYIFNVDHSTVYYHVKKNNLPKIKPVYFLYITDKEAKKTDKKKQFKKVKYKKPLSYKDYLEINRKRKTVDKTYIGWINVV